MPFQLRSGNRPTYKEMGISSIDSTISKSASPNKFLAGLGKKIKQGVKTVGGAIMGSTPIGMGINALRGASGGGGGIKGALSGGIKGALSGGIMSMLGAGGGFGGGGLFGGKGAFPKTGLGPLGGRIVPKAFKKNK